MGIAKPIPMLPLSGPSERIWLVMPITLPWLSISGPPELPWLMAASVCSAPWIGCLVCSESIVRLTAEMIPEVIVRSSPSGFPMATTGSPTETSRTEPMDSGWIALAGRFWGSSTATSVALSRPSTFAG